MNPLLDFSGLPRFADIRPEHVGPAVDALIEENSRTLEAVMAQAETPSWARFVAPLEDANERLSRAWGQVAHLNAVVNTPALRDAYNANLPKITQYWAGLAQNERLHSGYKTLRASAEFSALSAARQRIVENELRDFRLGGAELPPEQKSRFLEIQEAMAAIGARFEQNLLDATNGFGHRVQDPAELAGLPEEVMEAAREAAAKDGHPGWKLTLHAPCYLPVMQYAESRALRELMYRAYATRASEFGPAEWDNTTLIRELLALRSEEAALLGFGNFAELSLEPKMADSPEAVLRFLRDLATRAKPYAERDRDALVAFAREELGLPHLAPWDVAFVSEKLRVQRYAFSDLEVKQYFPEERVLEGLFDVIRRLYGLSVQPAQAPTWHKDARFYELRDSHNTAVGQFYLDLYARSGKRGGAWMDDAITRRRVGERIQPPVAYLTCNFSAPVGGKPATFTHDEVITLFHEFGHGLHHLLTQMEDLPISGINGVEWDAVELPSQFMENFCWEWDVLSRMTRHVDSGEPLPRALYERMTAARHFQSGMQTVRQIEFALFDMELHAGPDSGEDPLSLLERIRDEVAVVRPPAWHRFPNSFSHIFAGGYAAGYYSYKWAEVLSADAYSLFEENGIFDAQTGERFLREILARGGSRPALDSFMAFRGRAPAIDALLRHHGMATTDTAPAH
ncbi:MAG: M3 family metallopeptidase [Betaproteobacteria bacterium]|nr:M3 family metallopeptidase [Betaproteobacteria bacterium]